MARSKRLSQTRLCVSINIPGLNILISTASSRPLPISPCSPPADSVSAFRKTISWTVSLGFVKNPHMRRVPVASDDSAALTPEMMTRQKSLGPVKMPRREKKPEKVQYNHF